MKRLIELGLFLGLSSGLHAAAMMTLPDLGAEAAGAGGADRLTVESASASVAALVQDWTAPPEVFLPDAPAMPQVAPLDIVAQVPDHMPTPTAVPALPDVATIDSAPVAPPTPARPIEVPTAAPAGLALPMIDDSAARRSDSPDRPPEFSPPQMPAPLSPVEEFAAPDNPEPPMSDLAVATSPRPEARPNRPAPSAPSVPQREQRAQGNGGGEAQGNAQSQPAAATLSASERRSLIGNWGGQIQNRVARNQPRVRGSGVVTVALRIGRDGGLLGVSVAQSSGNPALDDAALTAVRRAGRFPAAPAGLTDPSYGFTIPIRFR
ncbi:TonB family protein [Loktanella sp. IMCC34160]|uniref:energy transducer TonB family protein n=1 Tax=Loktanella sp. IMCC34160 TaxID=2510646 RepID=UPI00101C6A90|nr:energy transducer TonB [Loktanella sp. IMCC34160]RYG90751.1 TonB family protein [Loktanella sp. IMCC34160]